MKRWIALSSGGRIRPRSLDSAVLPMTPSLPRTSEAVPGQRPLVGKMPDAGGAIDQEIQRPVGQIRHISG